jgi:hypothetical protein
MRSKEELLYFQERAEQEIRRAEFADHPNAARAHYELAGYYLDLVHNSANASLGRPLGGEAVWAAT